MQYEKAWTTLNDIIAKEWSRKYLMLNQSDTVLMAGDSSTILAQIEMLHFIHTVMTSIENYARGCDEVCCDAVDRKEGEKCVD